MIRSVIVTAGILVCLILIYTRVGGGSEQEVGGALEGVTGPTGRTERGGRDGDGLAPLPARGAAESLPDSRVALPPRDWKELEKLKRRVPDPSSSYPSEIEDRVRAILGGLETDNLGSEAEAAIEQLNALTQRAREEGAVGNLGEVLTRQDPALTEVRENIDRFLQSVQDGDFKELLDAIPEIGEAQFIPRREAPPPPASQAQSPEEPR